MRLHMAIGAVALCLVAASAAAEGLDGATFTVTAGEKGSEAGELDTLAFEEGKFFSTACEEWGFDWTEYETSSMAGIVRFEATAESENEGSIAWVGKVAGDDIEGTFVWSKEGQEPIEYWFRGSTAADEEPTEEGLTDEESDGSDGGP